MKIFFRVLSYAPNFGPQLVLFFLYSILGIIFGAFNIVLAMPLLSVLFKAKSQPVDIPPVPDFSLSVDYLVQTFNHYFIRIIVDYGPLDALLFVCALIMICVILANTFRYLERVMATKIPG